MAELKTLRVCLSSELPILEERDPNFIYFLYDKLTVFNGQNLYNDPYAIVEEIPENPIIGMLYFVLDGFVKVCIDYNIKEIGQIETDEQLELLKQAGTTFFVNSDKRYLDLNRRTVTLPFKNGTYELTVSLANELVIDENTVIGFNPNTNQFEIIGKRDDYDLVFTSNYRGGKSNTVEITVDQNRVSGAVRVSKSYDNIIKVLPDGLYAYAADKLTKKEFDGWVSSFQEYKLNMEKYIRDIKWQLDNGSSNVSKETISTKIHQALEAVYPEIDYAIAEFEKIAEKMDSIESKVKEYTDDKFAAAVIEIKNFINESWEDPWAGF